jgi:HTH-type transcriptional regulator/antitoxin HipB
MSMFMHRRNDVWLRTPRDIGALVRDRRQAAGLTQTALAEQAGVSRRWLAAIEAGKPGAEIGLLLRVLAALGTRLDATPDRSTSRRSDVDIHDLVAGYRKAVGSQDPARP